MTDDQKDAAMLKRDWFWFVVLASLVIGMALIAFGMFRLAPWVFLFTLFWLWLAS